MNVFCTNYERLYFTIFIVLSHTIPVVLHESFLLIISSNKLFIDYQLQPNKVPTNTVLEKCWKQIILNHLIVIPLLVYIVFYPIYKYFIPTELTSVCQSYYNSIEYLTPFVGLYKLLFYIIVEDFLFYWCHRVLHTPLLYKLIHKQHHEFRVLTNYSIAAEYTSPIESLIGNIIPLFLGPLLLPGHFYLLCFWIIIRMWKTCDAHSGYQFKWSPFNIGYPFNPTSRHDYHHETGKGSYGSFLLIWDTLCQTDQDYLQREKTKKVN